MWTNPVSNVIGVWGIYNENGDLTTEAIENLALFIPFIILLLWCFHEKIVGESVKFFATLWKSVLVVFLFSLIIEFSQLFLRLGTFQLSDLFYNTLGGLIGGFVYWCGYKLTQKDKK
jgi:glycopeptide antibiotics resistance protein